MVLISALGFVDFVSFCLQSVGSRRRWTETPWENLIGGLVLGGKELVEKVRQSTKADAAEPPRSSQRGQAYNLNIAAAVRR